MGHKQRAGPQGRFRHWQSGNPEESGLRNVSSRPKAPAESSLGTTSAQQLPILRKRGARRVIHGDGSLRLWDAGAAHALFAGADAVTSDAGLGGPRAPALVALASH